MKQLDINARFKAANWYEKSLNETILMGGVGGIGSYTLFFLTKTIPCTYYVFDHDIVETHNIGTQFFMKKEIGTSKVKSMEVRVQEFTTVDKLITFNQKYEKGSGAKPIMIAAFDNMEARKNMFESWKAQDNRELFVDGRLRANYYEIYTVQKGQENAYEKTLFDSSEVMQAPCTYKQTSYFAGLIGARITHLVVNYLSNKYSEVPVCDVPFKIEEIGEPFIVNINTKTDDN